MADCGWEIIILWIKQLWNLGATNNHLGWVIVWNILHELVSNFITWLKLGGPIFLALIRGLFILTDGTLLRAIDWIININAFILLINNILVENIDHNEIK